MDKLISKKIKLFNVIFTICIILCHINEKYYKFLDIKGYNDKVFKIIEFINSKLAFAALVYFFFLSGFLFYNNINNVKDCFIKLKKRFKTLIVPFLLWNLIIFIYITIRHYLLPESFFLYSDLDLLNWKSILDGFFRDPLCGPLWYLVALFIMMIPSFIVGFIKNKKSLVLGLFLILYFYIRYRTHALISIPSVWWWGNINYYLPVFMIGSYLGLYYPELILKKDYSNKYNYVLGIILIIISFFAMFNYENKIFGILFMVGLWLIINPKWLDKKEIKLSNITFYVFALHQSVIMPIYDVLMDKILIGYHINVWEMCILNIGLIIFIFICCYIVKFIFKIFGNKFNSLLTGGR